jgi:hypothetical protein
MLIVADGAPGLIKATEQCWPASTASTAPCTVSATCSPSCPSESASASAGSTGSRWTRPSANATASSGSRRWSASSTGPAPPPQPAALATTSTRSSCTCATPTRHRRRWRSTNLLERSLGEVKRRTKVIGRFPGETSCLTLVWAVLDLYISHATNGIKFTQLERQHLKRMRYEDHDQSTAEEVTAA